MRSTRAHEPAGLTYYQRAGAVVSLGCALAFGAGVGWNAVGWIPAPPLPRATTVVDAAPAVAAEPIGGPVAVNPTMPVVDAAPMTAPAPSPAVAEAAPPPEPAAAPAPMPPATNRPVRHAARTEMRQPRAARSDRMMQREDARYEYGYEATRPMPYPDPWSQPLSAPPPYIGTFGTDASGMRVFRYGN